MTVRLLHTADLHLDSPLATLALRRDGLREAVGAATRAALRRIVDTCLAEEVSALLIAGDLFDGAGRSMRTAAFLGAELARLGQAGIRVYAIRGNHDAETPVAGEMDWPDNVHVFGARGGAERIPGTDIWVHGVSFREAHAPESLLPRFRPPVEGAVNIALLHTSLTGAAGHDPYAPCTLSELTAAGFDYWALGHVHRRQVHCEAPWVVMPGMPQGRDMGEDGPKSASLLTIGEGRIAVSEVPTAALEFRRRRCPIDELETTAGLRRALEALVAAEREAGSAPQAVLRVTLSGETPLAWQIRRDREVWEETLATLAEATGRLWIERLDLDLSEPVADGPRTGAVDELAALMAEIAAEPGFRAAAEAELAKAPPALPPPRRAALLPDEDAAAALAARLAERGRLALVARMRGGAAEAEE